MTFYSAIKSVHVICVFLSISGFILRGAWMIQGSSLRQLPLVKRLPHVIDTLLLVSALSMVYMSAQYPFVENWLTAKVLALLLYILLGMVAFRFGKTRNIQVAAWLLAVMTFLYIVAVALTRDVTPFVN